MLQMYDNEFKKRHVKSIFLTKNKMKDVFMIWLLTFNDV